MSIIDRQLVNIEISTVPGNSQSRLQLNYQAQIYELVRVFASHKLDRAEQHLQQLLELNNNTLSRSATDRYLLVREVGYYSLWKINTPVDTATSPDRSVGKYDLLELHQASIWLFQELWLQWQDLLGDRQVRVFAESLLKVTPRLQSWVDLDRLLAIDPLAPSNLGAWTEADLMAFDRQLCELTQKKIGQQFGTELTISIVNSMPDRLSAILTDVLVDRL